MIVHYAPELLQRTHSGVCLGIVKRQHSALFHLFTEGENVSFPLRLDLQQFTLITVAVSNQATAARKPIAEGSRHEMCINDHVELHHQNVLQTVRTVI